MLAGAGYYFYNQGDNAAKVKGAAKDAEAKAKDAVGAAKSKVEGATAKSAFTGGDQGFISLKLDSVENINHNTKKFAVSMSHLHFSRSTRARRWRSQRSDLTPQSMTKVCCGFLG